MGYTTTFDGEIKLSRQLTAKEYNILEDFFGEEHREKDSNKPGIHCDLELDMFGEKLRWNGAEKTYELPEWIEYIIENYLKPWGIEANGEMEAQGEERDDQRKIIVENNKVECVEKALDKIEKAMKEMEEYGVCEIEDSEEMREILKRYFNG